jgi:hypothetical protein
MLPARQPHAQLRDSEPSASRVVVGGTVVRLLRSASGLKGPTLAVHRTVMRLDVDSRAGLRRSAIAWTRTLMQGTGGATVVVNRTRPPGCAEGSSRSKVVTPAVSSDADGGPTDVSIAAAGAQLPRSARRSSGASMSKSMTVAAGCRTITGSRVADSRSPVAGASSVTGGGAMRCQSGAGRSRTSVSALVDMKGDNPVSFEWTTPGSVHSCRRPACSSRRRAQPMPANALSFGPKLFEDVRRVGPGAPRPVIFGVTMSRTTVSRLEHGSGLSVGRR